MKTVATILCTVVVAATALGETFSLKDTTTKKVYGPFHFKNGTHISLEEATWEIERLDPRRDEIIATMKKIQIPSLKFRDAGLGDVALFLSETVKRLGAADLNIVVGRNVDKTNPVTTSIRDVSLYDTIEQVCTLSGHQWEIRHGVIILERKDASGKAATPSPATDRGTEELFCLKNIATGKKHGPFPLKNRAYVQIGSTVLAVSQEPEQAKTSEALKAMTIPSIEFRNASIQDLVGFLNAINERLSLNPDVRIGLTDKATKTNHSTTLSLRNKSLYDVIEILCELTELQWDVRDGMVVLDME